MPIGNFGNGAGAIALGVIVMHSSHTRKEDRSLELRHIRYFTAVAQELHFGRAADALSVTRPAVSQTVADLEAELGVKLFQREAHKVTLTEAGQAFHKFSRTILDDVASAVTTTKRIGQGKLGLLTIGYGSLSLRHPVFRECIKKMGADYPNTDLVLKELPSAQQIEAIRDGKLDAGFVYVAGTNDDRATALPPKESMRDLQTYTIEAGELAVALPVDHPRAGDGSLDLRDLRHDGFIVVGSSIANTHFPFEPRLVQEVSNIATQINLISVGMGVGLVVNSPRLEYPNDIRVIPLKHSTYASEFRLAWRRGHMEPILHNFLNILKELA